MMHDLEGRHQTARQALNSFMFLLLVTGFPETLSLFPTQLIHRTVNSLYFIAVD